MKVTGAFGTPMSKLIIPLAIGAALLGAPAIPLPSGAGGGALQARELPAYLQCVPYAREVSGVRIFGDAHTWWSQASSRYERSNRPRVGAVMAFQPHRKMKLGHVAAVSKVIDSRTVLLDHANWSPINGRRGQIERDVKAIDVSPGNDWSEVRVWYAPLQALGKTRWPVHGFIYGDGAPAARPRVVSPPTHVAVTRAPSRQFVSAFDAIRGGASPATYRQAKPLPPQRGYRQAKPLAPQQQESQRKSQGQRTGAQARDPIAQVLARYD